jgi:hypothetical protein
MPEQLQRVPRPTAVLDLEDGGQISPARGLNRGHLTLYFSIAAIVVSVLSAGVHLVIFFWGDRARMAAETELHQIQAVKETALAKAALLDVELKARDIELKGQQTRTSKAQEEEAIAAKAHHYQDAALARPQAQSAEYKSRFDGVTIGDPEVRKIMSDILKQGLKGGDMFGLFPTRGKAFPVGGYGGSLPDVPTRSPKFDINK